MAPLLLVPVLPAAAESVGEAPVIVVAPLGPAETYGKPVIIKGLWNACFISTYGDAIGDGRIATYSSNSLEILLRPNAKVRNTMKNSPARAC